MTDSNPHPGRRRLLLLSLVLVAGIAGCGTDGGAVADVLAEPDRVALSYTVSGGIAGETQADLILFGDGTGTTLMPDSSIQPVLVARSMLNAVISDIEAYGVHDVDLDRHPETGVYDGFGTTITVHSINGDSQVGWYGIGEAPNLFDGDWLAIDERVRLLHTTVISPVVPEQATRSELVAVQGVVVVDGPDIRICATASCLDGGLTVLNLDLDAVDLDAQPEWTLVGPVANASLDLG